MSADRFAEFEVCPACKGRGHLGFGTFHDPLRDCATCEGDRVVLTDFERSAREAAKTTAMTLDDARDVLRKVAQVEGAPSPGYGNTIKRDGAAFATVSSWSDALAMAQAMSRTYKRALFTAEGAMGQRMAYRGGTVQR